MMKRTISRQQGQGGMCFYGLLLCLLAFAPVVRAADGQMFMQVADNDNIRLFVSRDALHELKNTDGTTLSARIVQVDAATGQVTVFIPQTQEATSFPLSLLDEASQQAVQHWYNKEQLSTRTRIQAQEVNLGRRDGEQWQPFGKYDNGDKVFRTRSSLNDRKIVATITPFAVADTAAIEVLAGVGVERTYSYSPKVFSDRKETLYLRNYVVAPKLSEDGRLLVESANIALMTRAEDYEDEMFRGDGNKVNRTPTGRMVKVKRRFNIDDRIDGYYFIVLYQSEPVAVLIQSPDVAPAALKHLESFFAGDPSPQSQHRRPLPPPPPSAESKPAK